MEIKVDEFGRYLFSSMLQKKGQAGEHWESIRAKAEPLVRELLKLNAEMKGGGYKLVGYVDENGKKTLSNHQRVEAAQLALWKIPSSDLKTGDRIWLINEEPEMHINESEPGVVDDITSKGIYVTLHHWEDYTEKIENSKKYFVFRAPKDWDEKEELYTSDEYWLEQADKLGI